MLIRTPRQKTYHCSPFLSFSAAMSPVLLLSDAVWRLSYRCIRHIYNHSAVAALSDPSRHTRHIVHFRWSHSVLELTVAPQSCQWTCHHYDDRGCCGQRMRCTSNQSDAAHRLRCVDRTHNTPAVGWAVSRCGGTAQLRRVVTPRSPVQACATQAIHCQYDAAARRAVSCTIRRRYV